MKIIPKNVEQLLLSGDSVVDLENPGMPGGM
jgi:hypothetical protein